MQASISINLNEFNSGIEQAQKKFKSFSDNIKSISDGISKAYSGMGDLLAPVAKGFELTESVGKKAGSVIVSAMKGLGAAAAAAAGGAAAVGKSAFDAYANYEQLVGGIETLFKDSAWEVMGYAQNAYKTAQMSANEYMDLTTSFAASLLQSLDGDTAAAAKMADLAAQDMADNWNKMGSEMRSVQDAYRGFAKQNYTMLDNLKLGYGGTKEEMSRLLADAEKFSGIKYDLSSYADIVSAIHVIQEEMGITGTTALEASTTIQGSVSSMKAAWENFKVGIATADYIDDYKVLTDDLVDAVVTAGKNVVPRIQEIAERALDLIPYLTSGFSKIIPEFARMGGEIVQTLADGLGAQVPALMEFGTKAVGWIANGISQNAHNVANGVVGLIQGIGSAIGSNSSKLVDAGNSIINTILRAFNAADYQIKQYIGEFVPLIANAFLSYHETIFSIGMDILGAIGQGITENKAEIQDIAFQTIFTMVAAIHDNAPAIIEGGLALLEALAGAIVENLPLIAETGAEIIGRLVEGISTASPAVQAIIGAAVLPHILKIIEFVGDIGDAVGGVVKLVGDGIGTIMDIGRKLMGGVEALWGLIAAHPVIAVVGAIIAAVTLLWTHCEAFRDAVKAIWDAIVGFFQAAADLIKSAFDGVVDFFKGVWDGIQNIFAGVAEFFGGLFQAAACAVQAAWDAVVSFFQGVWDGIQSIFAVAADVLGDFFSAAAEAVKTAWEAVSEFFSGVWEAIQGVFSNVAEVLGGFFQAAWEAVQTAWNAAKEFFGGIADGVRSAFETVTQFLGDAFSAAWEAVSSAWSAATEFFSGIWDTISGLFGGAAEWFGGIFSAAWTAITSAWDGMGDFFSGLWESVKNVFGDAWDAFSNIGKNIVDGIRNGISNAWKNLTSWVSGLFKDLVNSVKSMLGIHSPSTVFAWIGGNMALGLGEGWNAKYSAIKAKIENGMNFSGGVATMSLAANGGYGGAAYRHSAQNEQAASGGKVINNTVNIYNPEKRDSLTERNEWKRTLQRMALEYA